MRRKSKNPGKRAKEQADRALQESYRRNYPDAKCEVCGKPFQVMHHHIFKSKSLFARYLCPENLIFICEKCHSQIHFYDNYPIVAYSIKRGKEWQHRIYEIARQPAPFIGIKRAAEIVEYYENNVPEVWRS